MDNSQVASENPNARAAYQRHAWIIFFLFGILFVLYALDAFSLPYRQPRHWEWLSKETEVTRYLSTQFRWTGMLSMGFAIFTIAVSGTAFRRGERWAWYIFWYWPIFWLLAMAFTWPGAFLIPFFILSLAGLLLPYRKFFPSGH